MDKTANLGLGGGCHWCTEAVFQSLKGISSVAQGFIRAAPPDHSWSEAVIVTFDPDEIDLASLIEIHLRTHSSSSTHKLRGKYRSAIYVFNEQDTEQARCILNKLQHDFDKPLITQVLPFQKFKPSDPRFHDYYRTDPQRPFCRRYIDPKLDQLRRRFADKLKD